MAQPPPGERSLGIKSADLAGAPPPSLSLLDAAVTISDAEVATRAGAATFNQLRTRLGGVIAGAVEYTTSNNLAGSSTRNVPGRDLVKRGDLSFNTTPGQKRFDAENGDYVLIPEHAEVTLLYHHPQLERSTKVAQAYTTDGGKTGDFSVVPSEKASDRKPRHSVDDPQTFENHITEFADVLDTVKRRDAEIRATLRRRAAD
jgi:hypothetical protein